MSLGPTASDGCHRVFFDGELFDLQGLPEHPSPHDRDRLGAAVAAALSCEATSALERVDGVFVLADESGSFCRLYRDPSGLRALYWTRKTDGHPAYATRPMSLEQALHSAPRVSREALHEYLRLLDISSPQSFVAGVHAAEPGTVLTLSANGQERVERIAAPSPMLPIADFDTSVDVLDGMLQRSVAARLVDVPNPAAFLSGGVDSALLCAIASRQRPETIALTVGFDGAQFDETLVASRIASHLKLRHEVLRFGREDLQRAFARLAHGLDQPMADPATMVTVLVLDHCRQRFDAVLDGTGADEAVGAMPPRHVRLAIGFGSLIPFVLRRWLVRGMQQVPALAGYTPILDFEHPAETLMRWNGFTRVEIEELCGEPVSLDHTRFYRTFARYGRREHYERYSALLDAMPCDRLTQSMKLTGMRVRFPFLARDVDRLLRQLPVSWRHAPGQSKRILRALLARYVPRELWDGPKHGFDFPLHDFLAADGFSLVRRHVLDGRWLDANLLRPDVVRRYARQYIAGDRRLMFRVWALAVLGAWLDAHDDLIKSTPGV
jgi:asparagine synthase (glutamine-hydrolysing)